MHRVFSGIQSTGNLHLGNYLGAIRHWVKLQEQHECIYGIMDLHAITVPQDPAALRQSTREVAAALIASGVDPAKHILFPQSAVSAHAELAWILGCQTPLGWLNRMTQFKEKAGTRGNIEDEIKRLKSLKKGLEESVEKGLWTTEEIQKYIDYQINLLVDLSKGFGSAPLGLFSYPVLMAADILAYKATHVPVGDDQKQHLELSRDIAAAFNRNFDQEYFPLPEPLIMGEATRVMSLRDGTNKMSKSDPSDMSRINLVDDADSIAKKFKKAKSDMFDGITPTGPEGEPRPEAANLLNIYAALADISLEKAMQENETKSWAQFKQDLSDLSVEKLSPITAKMRVLMDDPANIDSFLQAGAERANEIAAKHMREIKDIVGFMSFEKSVF